MAGWLGEMIGEVGAPGATARDEGLHVRAIAPAAECGRTAVGHLDQPRQNL